MGVSALNDTGSSMIHIVGSPGEKHKVYMGARAKGEREGKKHVKKHSERREGGGGYPELFDGRVIYCKAREESEIIFIVEGE